MTPATLRRVGVLIAFCVGLTPFLFVRAQTSSFKTSFYKGKVVPLADLLKKKGIKLDKDAASTWMALAADDGKVYPLIKDAGSRMFFKDKRLVGRPMRLTAKLYPNSGLLQVVVVHSFKKNKLHEVFYWCDICTIKGYEKTICDCCGAPMELREEPVKK